MFQVISHALTSEEEVQYRDEPSSLLDAGAVRKMAIDNVSINLNYSLSPLLAS